MPDDRSTTVEFPPGWYLSSASARVFGVLVLLAVLVQVLVAVSDEASLASGLRDFLLNGAPAALLALWLILDDHGRARWSHGIGLAMVAVAVAVMSSPEFSPADHAASVIGALAAAIGLALWMAAPVFPMQLLSRAMGALQISLVLLALAISLNGASNLKLGWAAILAHTGFGGWLFVRQGPIAVRHRIPQWCSSGMLGIGILMMAGWVFGNDVIIRAGTDQAPMQFQTALCVVLSGLSLWLLVNDRRKSALLALVPVIVLAISILLEEYTGLVSDIGGWLIGQTIAAAGFAPGKMASNTAIALLIGGLGIFLAPAHREPGVIRWSATWACGFLVASIAVLVFIGYLLDVSIVRTWGMHRSMSLTASLTMILYGVGLGFTGPQARLRSQHHRSVWLPLLVGTGAVIASVMVWYVINQNWARGERARMDQQAHAIRRTMRDGMQVREEALQRFADRLEFESQDRRMRLFDLNAQFYARDFPSVTALVWIDHAGIVRRAFAHDGQLLPPLDQFMKMDGLTPELLRQAQLGGRIISPPVTLPDGRSGQWIVIRTKGKDQGQGFLVGALHHDALFSNLLVDAAPQYSLRFVYGGKTLYSRGPVKNAPALSSSFDDLGYPIQMQLWPLHRDESARHLANVLLLMGLASGGLLALVLRLAALARERAELAEDAGRRLGIGMAQRRDSEERLRAILETALEGIIIIDENGLIESANPAAEVMFGYTEAELLGENVKLLMPEPYRHEHDQYLDNYRQTGRAKVIGIGREVLGQRKDGSTFPLDLSVSELRLASRRMFAGFVRDISQRKQDEAAIRESEERFRTMANAMPQLAWMAHGDGHIYWYNRRWYEYTGTSLEQMEGWGWQGVHDPRVLPLVMERWKESIDAGTTFEMEFPIRGADGRFRTFLTRVQPLRDGSGQVVQWFGTNTDVSELKRSEAELRETSQRLEMALSAAKLGTFDFRPGTGEVLWDARMSMLWGFSPGAEMDYSRAIQLVHPDDRERVEQSLQKMFDSGSSDFHLDYRIVWPDGSVYWRVDRGQIFYEEQGEQRRAVRVIGVHMDVSESKEMDMQLQRTLADLSNRNRELQDFAFIASHDLQEPLRKIRAFSDRLLFRHAGQFDEQARDYLVRTGQAAERMQTLIDDLLAYSRVSARGRPFAKVDLTVLVAAVLEDLEARLESSGGRVEVLDTLPVLDGDATQLRQVFQNLMANALKFRSPDRSPHVRVSAVPTRDADGQRAWTIRVEDNGIGFDSKYAERVFAPFQRLHGREEYEGTGIGLAIVRRIVERHRGVIHAEGRLGYGAAFVMVLPERQLASAEETSSDVLADTEGEPLV